MAFKITISSKAINQLNKIFDYLLENWSEKVASEFIRKFDSKLSYISQNPQSYPITTFRNDVRKCVVTKQVSLYYKITKDIARVIFVFDTRQSPDKIKL